MKKILIPLLFIFAMLCMGWWWMGSLISIAQTESVHTTYNNQTLHEAKDKTNFMKENGSLQLQFLHLANFDSGQEPVNIKINNIGVLTNIVYSELSIPLTYSPGMYLIEVDSVNNVNVSISTTIVLSESTNHGFIIAGGSDGYPLEIIYQIELIP